MKTLLENKILRHSYEYYVLSKPTISDKEFDDLYQELSDKYPESEVLSQVGNDLQEGFPKGKHLIVMGSQAKLKTKEQFNDWKRTKSIQFPLVGQLKLDGISIELQYEKGVLISALTRGNSVVGDEVYSNVSQMQGIPKEINEDFTGAVRGEVLMRKSLFDRKYKPQGFANPRNLASGMAKNKFGENCEDLTVVCYDVVSLDKHTILNSEQEIVTFLKYNNFLNVETNFKLNSVDEVFNYASEIQKRREEIEFAIDGVVIKEYTLDDEDKKKVRPDKQRALKWEDVGVRTTLRDVEWSRSGTTYTPIAIFDTVEIEGSQVSKASLANESFIYSLDLAINDKILVTKRNMIIPKVESVVERPSNRMKINFPMFCSVCGQMLQKEEKRLYCNNPECPGLGEHRISKWLAVLDVKGFGTELQQHLFNNNFYSIIDLYDKDKVENAYSKTNLKANYNKAFTNLYSIKKIPLSKFFAGFDIEGIGESLIKNVIEAGYDTPLEIMGMSPINLFGVPNFSDERIVKLLAGLKLISDEARTLIEQNYFEITCKKLEIDEDGGGYLEGKTFCITGKLERGTRKELTVMIENAGGKFSSSVSNGLNYLVINDLDSQSSKAVKARKLGIDMISEKQLFEMF